MNLLQLIPFELNPWQWGALIFASICIGISKTGINGISTVAIPLFVLIFEAKPSTGVILPLLCLADLFAVIYYRRNAEWKYIFRLAPWALAGFALALIVERFIPARGFKILIGICILAGLLIMLWNDRPGVFRKTNGADGVNIPRGWWFSAIFGILGGFSTMIGNAAGPVMSVFLLSVRLPKISFIGTAAWFFLIINYLKIPLQFFAWHNISAKSLIFDLVMAPFVLAGAWAGILFVKKISEQQYRVLVYLLTVLASALLFL
ncbi:MAG: sulfite exporter TauE/SafE family protein [Spirochaetaceae bacterium]|jgi:uncharacterized membrane protein YfcA|nr:sulfite exporter TauE/SafE family protein [Spirochaetaceae bacterium]